MAVVTLATGLLTGPALPALAAGAQAPTVTVTIGAKSALKKITGEVLVVFRAGKFSRATISGRISGALAGDVATLLARPFPYKKPPAAIGSPISLTGASPEPYSFQVTPGIATRYRVVVSAGGTQVGASPVQTIYLADNMNGVARKRCGRPVCHQRLRLFTILPAAAFKSISAKHLFFYFGLSLSASGVPPVPRFLRLDPQARITRARRISGTEFEQIITWSFRVGNNGFNWIWVACTKDTVAKDGMGLPGHHGCGARRLRTRTLGYLG